MASPVRPGALLLDRSAVFSCLDPGRCIELVEEAFRAHGQRRAPAPALASVTCPEGSFHVKAGVFKLSRNYFAAKLNANFMGNGRKGLPTIQGVIALCDADDGALLALMDSIEITALRTGAATAVAARYLARADARVAAIVGCGTQGRVQLRSLARVCALEMAYVYDTDASVADRFAEDLTAELGLDIQVVDEVGDAIARCDVCVTCTPGRNAFVSASDLRPGTFVAAVGADAAHKQELAVDVFRNAVVVADVVTQSATIGDLHHALDAGVLQVSDVYAELGEIVAGSRPAPAAGERVTVFDSTGMAIQDVAVAADVYERLESCAGALQSFDFGG